jgi:hypothetical protein
MRPRGIKGQEQEKDHEQQRPVHKPGELTTTKELSLSKTSGDARQSSSSSSSLLTSFHRLIQSLSKMPYPIKLVAIGTIIEIFSGGFDSWWHYNFGFDGSVNAYKTFFGIDLNTFQSIAIFNQLLWPFIIQFVIPVSVLMSILGSGCMTKILGRLL